MMTTAIWPGVTMKTIPVRPHKRSPKGARAQAIEKLIHTYGLRKEEAERVVRISTPQYAERSFLWAQSTMACVVRKLEGSRFFPGLRGNVAYYFLRSLWEDIIEEEKLQTGLSDALWCENQNAILSSYGLKLPANSRHVSIKILKAARLLLHHQL